MDTITKSLENKQVASIVSLLLALYAGAAAPVLPNFVINFFDTILGKLFFCFLISYVASKNTQVAIMIAVAFVVTLTMVNRKMAEGFANNYEYFKEEVSGAEPVDCSSCQVNTEKNGCEPKSEDAVDASVDAVDDVAGDDDDVDAEPKPKPTTDDTDATDPGEDTKDTEPFNSGPIPFSGNSNRSMAPVNF